MLWLKELFVKPVKVSQTKGTPLRTSVVVDVTDRTSVEFSVKVDESTRNSNGIFGGLTQVIASLVTAVALITTVATVVSFTDSVTVLPAKS